MIKIENLEVCGWEAAIRGMRNPMNSWDKSDSYTEPHSIESQSNGLETVYNNYILGPNDLDLATRLIQFGSADCKFLRMIHVQMDIVAPSFWWSEMDTYKVATTRDSCSKMHRIHVQPFEFEDFAHEGCDEVEIAHDALINTINACEQLRLVYNETHDRKYWRALIELLSEGYMMRATWDGSMETVLNILKQRDHHKLKEEWEPFRQACFDNIPYCKEFYEAVTIK